MKRLGSSIAVTLAWICLAVPAMALSTLDAITGGEGVVYAVDETGKEVAAQNARTPFLPASTLKLLTALVAIETLGGDWRFETRVFLRDDEILVQGLGDPFLTSEELERFAKALAAVAPRRPYRGIAIDDSYFADDLQIPGVGRSSNPYDAPNSAFAVNFNTVAAARRKGRIVSAEPQTPLTETARGLAERRKIKSTARFPLPHDRPTVRRHAGEVLAAKLRGAGMKVGSRVRTVKAVGSEPVLVYRNSRPLLEVVREMLASSNNFIANQLFLTIGAVQNDSPASLPVAQDAFRSWLAQHPKLAALRIVEGSGIAYENQASAPAMIELLRLFEPYRELLRSDRGTRHKTGTLKAVAAVAGYVDSPSHGSLRYVIALPGGSQDRRWRVVDWLREQ